ncbi:MAG: hypothetical protein ACFE8E_12690 [Candidatus Hodarchaeota archaeon]
MSEKDLYPDYEPKKTPDTVKDYLRYPKTKIFNILDEIGVPSIDKLKIILDLFIKYKEEAKKKPGRVEDGRVYLGADLKQYVPSEEELLVSELGKLILNIVKKHTKDEIDEYKKRMKIKSQKIVFYEITFRHVDVMGSGRYFYAEKMPKKTEFSF